MPQKTHFPRHRFCLICMNVWPSVFWKWSIPSILSTNFTYPIVLRSVAASPPNNTNKWCKQAPRNTPKSVKIHARKNTDFWHRFWFDFDLKNDPKMTPKSTKMAPLGSQGAPWDPLGEPGGPPGASRPTLGSNLAPQMKPKLPKWHQHTPKWAQNVPKLFQHRPILHPSKIKGGCRRHWRSHQIC